MKSDKTVQSESLSAVSADTPAAQGLYDPANEHDSCGVGFVAHIKGRKSHRIIEQGSQILCNLDHRGAVGADPLMGDGAGMLIQIPDQFFREEMAAQGVALPPAEDLAQGLASRGASMHSAHGPLVEFPASAVTRAGASRAAPPWPETAGSGDNDAGLKGFVEQVRTLSFRSHTPLEDELLRTLRRRHADAHPAHESPASRLNPQSIRADFPILSQRVNGHPLVWLDNAATTQKPRAVIEAVSRFYEQDNSHIHRGAHTLAARATDASEHARDTVARFLGARTRQEIVFVRGATEGINLVARTFGAEHIHAGDEIVLTVLEHHHPAFQGFECQGL